MTQEALKKMYQLLLTEPHAPTVCAQLERIAREALAEHAMRETQRLGQEIEQEPVGVVHHKKISSMIGADYEQVAVFFRPLEPLTQLYASPPQRKPLTNEEIDAIADEYLVDYRIPAGCALNFARDIEAAHGIKENT